MAKQTYFSPTKDIDVKAFYRTLHCSHEGYMFRNQGMLCLPDWIGFVKNKDGSPLHHWNHEGGDKFSLDILEIGCGNGALCEFLSLFAHVTGVDITDSPIRQQGKKDYEFFEQDVVTCSLPSVWGYNYILSFDVLEHLDVSGIAKVVDNMQSESSNLLIKVACSGKPPFHMTVETPGWWLETLRSNAPEHDWSIIRTYRQKNSDGEDIFAPLFYGRKEK